MSELPAAPSQAVDVFSGLEDIGFSSLKADAVRRGYRHLKL